MYMYTPLETYHDEQVFYVFDKFTIRGIYIDIILLSAEGACETIFSEHPFVSIL